MYDAQSMTNPLLTLARSDPDYLPFARQHLDLAAVTLSSATNSELMRDASTVLHQLAAESGLHEPWAPASPPPSFTDPQSTISTLVAVAFLLRTRLCIKRSRDAKWEFVVEYKPGDSALVRQLLAKIAQLLSRD
jgi:hypothetical protein